MSAPTANTKEEDEIPPPQRPPSPPLYTTPSARGIHTPTFSAFRPRDIRITAPHGMTHVAWSCDGQKLGAVGIDKTTRVLQPEKSLEWRSAKLYSGGHSEEVDYISWNPTHPELFCTSSQKDRRIVFWDARQSRHAQQVALKVSPTQTTYSPDGKTLAYATVSNAVSFLLLGRSGEETKDTWRVTETEAIAASGVLFSHTGEGIILTHQSEHTLRVIDYPSLTLIQSPAAHVGGCIAAALDPRGRYMASGGHDSIINIFDLSEWICARTLTSCDHAITGLSFSHDGEFLAVANAGLYIDICATETGAPLHRIPALAPSPTVAWHPSKYVIAYCGQTPSREGSASAAVVSLFGPGL